MYELNFQTAYDEIKRWYDLMDLKNLNLNYTPLTLKEEKIIPFYDYLFYHLMNVFSLLEKHAGRMMCSCYLISKPMPNIKHLRYTIPIASYFATFYKSLKEEKIVPYFNALKYFNKSFFLHEAKDIANTLTYLEYIPKNTNTFKHVLAQINTFNVFVPDWLFQIKETL